MSNSRAFIALMLVMVVWLGASPAPATAQEVMYITGDKVGINTNTPTELLHVKGTADVRVRVEKTDLKSDIMFELVNNGTPRFVFRDTNTNTNWLFEASGSGFFINDLADGATAEVRVLPNGDMILEGTLTTTGPQCTLGCDAVFSPGFDLPTIEEHAARMWENRHLPAVGPTVPGAPLNLTERTAGLLNELEIAHIFIQRLADQIEERDAQIEELRNDLAQLEEQNVEVRELAARLAQIEEALGADD